MVGESLSDDSWVFPILAHPARNWASWAGRVGDRLVVAVAAAAEGQEGRIG